MSEPLEEHDELGAVLRRFYGQFGMPNEGPPPHLDVSAAVGVTRGLEMDIASLRAVLSDETAKQDVQACRALLEAIWPTITGDTFLREVSAYARATEDEFEQLSAGVFWFSLAATLDRRDPSGLPLPAVPGLQLPLPVRIRMTIHGSLILRLYVALVYARGGAFSKVVERAAKAGCPAASRVMALLECQYVRHVRNSLAHGSFSPMIAGVRFADRAYTTAGSPGFLGELATVVSMCELQVLSASLGGPRAA